MRATITWVVMYRAATLLLPVCRLPCVMTSLTVNGTGDDGFLNMPAVGVNYFFKGCNLKLQAMYQYIARTGHDTQLDRDNDNLGLATHSATVMLQYTF